MKFHPLSEIFPLLEGDPFDALVADIAAYGVREPIWVFEGQILDGRNRWRAAQAAGVKCPWREYKGDDPLVLVVSLNLKRRNLTPSQLALVALEIERVEAELAKARQVEAAHRTNAVKASAKAEPLDEAALAIKQHQENQELDAFTVPDKSVEPVVRKAVHAAKNAAKAVGVSIGYVIDAKKIVAEAPDLVAAVRAGTMTITQAKREVTERGRAARRTENAEKVAQAQPTESLTESGARFATIVMDPPWDWGDEGDKDQLGRARPEYATLSIDKLARFSIPLLADVDCHLYLWITNRSLPKGFALLDAWGFRYITCLTWVKPHFGMGNYFRGQTEQVLFAVKGSQGLKRKDVGTVFQAPRGPAGHSSKPVEFYGLVESCSPGPFLEVFSRHSRSGWSSFGENGIELAA